MEIRVDPHALARAAERGASLNEIRDVVDSGVSELAREGRLGKAKVFPFGGERTRRTYPEKRVRVIYVIEDNVVTVVTFCSYYGKWD